MINVVHVDVNVTGHCNNRCAGCSHLSPFARPYFMEPETLRRDLGALKPFLHISFIALLGGEPLLHPRILEMLAVARESGIADDVRIVTNGRLIRRMPREFWEAKPFVEISIYPDHNPADIAHAQEMSKAHGGRLLLIDHPHFYKQFHPSDGAHFDRCFLKRECFTVHEGHFFLCAQSCFFPGRLMGLPPAIDGLPIEGVTEERLAAFMARKEPFNTCRICIGFTAQMPWHQCVTEEEWIRESTL